MTWQELEQKVEQSLIDLEISFEHEGTIRTYGHKARKGKHDFTLRDCRIEAIEVKNIGRMSNMRLPWPGVKNTAIHVHQLTALRRVGVDKSGILIHCNDNDKYYFVSMRSLDKIIFTHGMVKSLNGPYMDELEIDYDEFMKSLPLKK